MRGRLGVLAVVFLAAACSETGNVPTGNAPLRPQASVAANLPHFSFLPPLAQATITGAFNPDLIPSVVVCHVDSATDACDAELARYDFGPNGVTVDPVNEQYQVNWQIGGVTANELYRVSVLAGYWPGAETLGSIDLLGTEGGGVADPVSGVSRNVQSTLPIKFRLEQGLLCTTYAPDPNVNEPCLVRVVGPAGGTFATADEMAGVTFPQDALNETHLLFIEQYEPIPGADGGTSEDQLCLPSSFPQYGNCYRYRLEPPLQQGEQFNFDVTVGVCPDPTVFQQGIFDQVDLYKWDEVDPASLTHLPEQLITFVNCPGTPYYAPPSSLGFANRLPGLFKSLLQFVTPTPAYAGPVSPFGGGLKDFSRIGWLRPLALEKVSGDNQQAYLGDPVPDDPVVRVRANGAKVTTVIPVAGVPIEFAASPDGSASPASTVSDANGYASAMWNVSTSAGTNTLTVTGQNPLADPLATQFDNFPNVAGTWGTVAFTADAVQPPPPPPPATYDVIFLSPISQGKLTGKKTNTEGVPVKVTVCSVTSGDCWDARRVVDSGYYRFQWSAPAGSPEGDYTFTVYETDTSPQTVLATFTGAVAKDGSKPSKGVDFTFQLGSNVPIKFYLVAK